jgi:hypothetical protein
MPAPVPYNGKQSRLEYYAINGNPIPGSGPYAGLGRQPLLTKTHLLYTTSFKNNDQYGLTHTNAISDAKTPNRGKGTGGGFSNGEYAATIDYNGGDDYDKDGGVGQVGSSLVGTGWGRSKSLNGNLGTWGYSPTDATNVKTLTNEYKKPDMTKNIGQVVINP